MKTHSIVNFLCIIFLFFSTTILPQNVGYAAVANTIVASNDPTSTAQQIQADLLSSAWFDSNRLIIFNETGFATVLLEHNTKIGYLFWSLELVNSQTYLTLTKPDGMQEQFRLVRDADNIQWIDMEQGTIISIDSVPLRNAKDLEATKYSLQGNWSCHIYPTSLIKNLEVAPEQPITQATFNFEFLEDGRFIKTVYFNNEYHSKMIGFWELSVDGKMLLVHTQKSKEQFQSFMLQVKHLSLDELVVDRAVVNSEIESEIYGATNLFFFNKR